MRTIQYYDQQGLLSPSAKGPQNRRLYTEEDMHGLHKILALKHLGQSLAEIKALLAREPDSEPEDVLGLIDNQMEKAEEEMHHLLTQITVLREARAQIGELGKVDWDALSDELERGHVGESLSWRLSCVVGNYDDSAGEKDSETLHRSVADWHDLIAEVIFLLTSGVPPTDARARAAAARYRELVETNGSSRTNDFILMKNAGSGPHGHESFEELQRSVVNYLETAASSS